MDQKLRKKETATNNFEDLLIQFSKSKLIDDKYKILLRLVVMKLEECIFIRLLDLNFMIWVRFFVEVFEEICLSMSGKKNLKVNANKRLNEEKKRQVVQFLRKKKVDPEIYNNLKNKSNKSLHFKESNFISVDSYTKKHVFKDFDFKDCVSILKLAQNLLSRFTKSINKVNYEFNFDESLYNVDDLIWAKEYSINLLSYIDSICKICDEGKLIVKEEWKENEIKFEFGPFLVCDNKRCGAILSTSLNLKKKLSISKITNDEIKEKKKVYNYFDEDSKTI